MTNIAVLVSGGGTNLQALIDAEAAGKIENGSISLVVSSNPNAYALERAAKAGIETAVLRRKEYASAERYGEALDALLREMPSLCGCLFAPGDQPLLRRETVDGLCGAFLETPEKERTIYRLARKEAGAPAVPGSPVLFGRAYFDALLHLPEGKGGGVVVRRHPESVHLFAAAHPAETDDADTPEALERLLSIYFTLGV